ASPRSSPSPSTETASRSLAPRRSPRAPGPSAGPWQRRATFRWRDSARTPACSAATSAASPARTPRRGGAAPPPPRAAGGAGGRGALLAPLRGTARDDEPGSQPGRTHDGATGADPEPRPLRGEDLRRFASGLGDGLGVTAALRP